MNQAIITKVMTVSVVDVKSHVIMIDKDGIPHNIFIDKDTYVSTSTPAKTGIAPNLDLSARTKVSSNTIT